MFEYGFLRLCNSLSCFANKILQFDEHLSVIEELICIVRDDMEIFSSVLFDRVRTARYSYKHRMKHNVKDVIFSSNS